MTPLPTALGERLAIILGDEYGEYLQGLEAPPRACLRVNTLKATVKEVRELITGQGLALDAVPWCPTGFWINDRGHGLGDSVAHFQGLFYIEDAASLLPPEALSPEPGEVVMDAAAAPGGKTTHIAALMGNGGALAANEVDAHRTRVLRFNLSRMGVLNAAVTTLDMSRLPDTGPIFDKVLLDAPCSCEGRIGEDPEALALWKPSRVQKCSRLQVKLLENCFSLLAPGGALVYSTCTLSPEENEGVIDHLLKSREDADVEEIEVPGRHAVGIPEWQGTTYDERVTRCLRLYPHHHGTQGFFVARILKCR
ncbi:MAG: RsmB/NOP family class I SAM-dependent RNA methyltransferase [Candidatus Bathyarchaeota archaeon]|nr:RsmB/NOP family class I SAM-dependent RNA methyltransferase [Candidatus Bathyarchaeota archaeon]